MKLNIFLKEYARTQANDDCFDTECTLDSAHLPTEVRDPKIMEWTI